MLSPNEQPAIALIGCGGMGRGDAKNASRFGRVVAICDLDDAHLAEVKQMFPDATTYKDFRKVMERDDIHVVICGTVDHWHTLVSLAAMRSGKDVYCEKPLTLTIEDGKQLVRAVQKTKRVLQTGSQQRSKKIFGSRANWCATGGLANSITSLRFCRAANAKDRFKLHPCPQVWIGISGKAQRRKWIT